MAKDVMPLKENKLFRTLYYHGRSQVDPLLVTYVRSNRAHCVRVGITTGKKLGKAVKRNRCRRLIREAFRLIVPVCIDGFDVVFVARSRMLNAKMPQVKAVMRRQLTILGVCVKKEE